MTISSAGLSRHLETSNPEWARKLYPWNIEALLAEASQSSIDDAPIDELEEIEEWAKRLLSRNAGDARLYSLIGEMERRKGDAALSFLAFERALALSGTEIHALQWVLSRAMDTKNVPETLDRIDMLFRRWPEQIPIYAPLIPQIVAATRDYDLFIQRIAASPPWRTTLISRLAGKRETLPFAASVIQDFASQGIPLRKGEISNVVNAWINAGLYDHAYRTFIFTLTPEQQELIGNIYNGRFSLPPSGIPFDWQIRSHPGIVFSYHRDGLQQEDTGLTIRFLQVPVRDLQARQYLLLAPGHYTFGLKAKATGVHLPKGLFWTVRCIGSNRIIMQLPVVEGSYQYRAFSAGLTVPPNNCSLQLLHLSTKALADNWNDIYQGTISFDDLSITGQSS